MKNGSRKLRVAAVAGAVCGTAAWALRFGLGQVRSNREGDTREAARCALQEIQAAAGSAGYLSSWRWS